MSASESRSAVVLQLAEEFLERYRQGQRPSLKEYIDRHPELAAEIKEVFPAMALMENVALADESLADDATGPRPAPGAAPPAQLGDYRILREVGRGGMGIVYEAEQMSLGRHIALKVLPRKVLLDAAQKRRFEREAKAAAKLHHTNIVPVFGVGEHDGLPYYAMQFIQGLGLDDVVEELKRMRNAGTPMAASGELRASRKEVSAADVARSLLTGEFQGPGERVESPEPKGPGSDSGDSATGKLSDSFRLSSSAVKLPGSGAATHGKARKTTYWQSVAQIGLQVAEALEYAHKQGIQHRDIKPSNLLLDTRGTVWVTDFGLARADNEDHLTQTGDIVGTLRYMPPEAFEGRADKRGDIYSLGLTLYELLALQPAFEDKDRHRLIKRVTTEEPARLDKLPRSIPRDLVTIVHKAIDRDPARRYATAGELAADLQRFLDDEPIQARRQTQLERYWRWARHNPGIAVLGGVLTAVLVIVTLASLIVAGRMSTLADKARQNEERALQNEEQANKNAMRAEQSERKTANALATVAAQKAEVEDSLSGSLEYFSAALRQADSYEARKPIVVLAARFDMVLSALVERQPDDQQLQLALARKLAERGQKHLARKQPAKAQDGLEKARAIYTRLLTPANNWKVLTPIEMKTETGAKMELQKDGSVFVDQQQPAKDDTCTLVFQTDLKGITGLRLEALADSRLPGGGPGWMPDGNFNLNELTLQAAPTASPDKAKAIAFQNAWADFSQGGGHVRGAVDGNPRTFWAVWPEFNKDHTAVFDLAEKVGDGGAARLTVRFIQRQLGRFRLSFTNDAKTLQAMPVRWDLRDNEVVDCNIALGKAHAQQGHTNEAIACFAQALLLAADRAGKAKIIAEAAPLEGVLEKLAGRAAGDGQFQAELAQHFAAQDQAPLANVARAKARAWFEAKLAKEPENLAWVAELTQVLLDQKDQEGPRWTVLKPTEMKSQGGATLTLQPDGSVLASGVNPGRDVYSILARTDLKQITAIRLEALPDPSLPRGGPGRSPGGPNGGNFHLNKLRLFSGGQPCPLTNIIVQHPNMLGGNTPSQYHQIINGELDNSPGWGNFPRYGQPNTATIATRVARAPDDDLKIEMYFSRSGWTQHNLGRFRLSVSGDPATLEREEKRFAVLKLADPWAKLAAAYLVIGDQQALDPLIKHHPQAAAAAYQSAGRTREAIPILAKASAADPKDTLLSLKVAALQAWFGQEKELAATRKRIRAFAKDTQEWTTADRASKACSIRASTDKADLEAALAIARKGVELARGKEGREWTLLALGMAEYRGGNCAAADEALVAAAKAGPKNGYVTGMGAFYRAMCLFRQGKPEEARKVAIAAAAQMKPLPKDEQNPLGNGAYHDDLILWLAYKEAKALLKIDAAPAANWLMRALAHHRRGETDQAKKACRKAAEMLKLAGGADADLRPLLHQMVIALGTESPEARGLIAAAAGEPPVALNETIRQNPDQAKGYRERGNWYAERGRWKDAIADFVEVFRLDPNTLDAMKLGILLAQTDEKERFHDHGQAVLRRWASTEKNDEADKTLKTIVLIPDYKGDAGQLAHLAETAVAGDPSRDWYEWWLPAKALHDLRTGQYADALTACRRSRRRAPQSKGEPQILTALDLAIEAMALQGAGKAGEARRTLEQAKPLIESHVPGIDGGDWWAEWLTAHLLYREAQTLIEGKKAEPKN